VAIPEMALPLCTKDLLVMERLPGVPMVTGLRRQFGALAALRGQTLQELEAEQKHLIRTGQLQKLSLDEDSVQFAGYNRMLRAKRWASLPLRTCWNWTAGMILGRWQHPARVGAGPNGELLSLGQLLTTLAAVHAHEIFVDGCFNGDPHPGNVMLLPDGRLGLIDYGQVKHIDLSTRLSYAKLIVALDEENQDEVCRVIQQELGCKSKYMRKDICYRIAAFWSDRDTADITGGRNIAEFMDWAEAEDPVVSVAQDIVMACRVNVMMRGMANAFNLRLRMAPVWRPHAEALLAAHGQGAYSAKRAEGTPPGPISNE
jgi:aarF domain-containing kinase